MNVPIQSPTKILADMRHRISSGQLPSREGLLPLFFSLNGEPYSLRNYYPFSPLFRTEIPGRTLLITGRQVAKSTSISANGIQMANCIPHFKILFLTPLYEQIRRLSSNVVRPFVDNSPVRNMLVGPHTDQSVMQRSFKNGSMMHFSFALLSADRIRGISADMVSLDEIQDMDPDHFPIVGECMAASRWELWTYTGTPKALDNPIHGLWTESSRAEWIIKCHHGGCNRWNIPAIEFHLDKMIGPLRHDISDEEPALTCYKCRKPLRPRPQSQGGFGRWVHRHPQKRYDMAGYHIPQPIMPLHFNSPKKWRTLLAKQSGAGNTSRAKFVNECLGESIDLGQKLINETELKRASTLPWKNNPDHPVAHIMERLNHYELRVLAIDWGGGGEKEVSYTTAALLGYLPDGRIECLWGKRFLASHAHFHEAAHLLVLSRMFNVHLIIHDYTGAGTVRETVMVQAGFNPDNIMPIAYVPSAGSAIIRPVGATPIHPRTYYQVDKTRSLLYTCEAIRHGMLTFFEYDWESRDNPGLICDFLALVENKIERKTGRDLYTITRNPLNPDDFAQAVNIGCVALWYCTGNWPDFAEVGRVMTYSSDDLQDLNEIDYSWS